MSKFIEEKLDLKNAEIKVNGASTEGNREIFEI